ncbi:MAG: tyrosine-type recombinase/integrase [Desulfomonilaceae bacterium]
MSSFFQPSVPQVCTALSELRKCPDRRISHNEQSPSGLNSDKPDSPNSTVSSHENDGQEMVVAGKSTRPIVQSGVDQSVVKSLFDRDGEELVSVFFSGKSHRTIESYRRDLQTFCEFLEIPNITEAVRILFSGNHRDANLIALAYRQHLIETKRLKPKSVNRHLASLRSLLGLGQSLGMVPWKLSVKNQKVTELRNLAAPDPKGMQRLLKAAGRKGDGASKRNVAICLLLYTAGLRRNEVVTLTYPEDLSFSKNTISVLGKGKTEKQEIILPEKTIEALKDWLKVRGDGHGPLFKNLDRAGKGDGRLTGRSVHRIIRCLGRRIGLEDLHPHALRRGAITSLLNKAKGIYDVEECLDFSRHADVSTMMLYRKRNDSQVNQAAMSRMLASDL